MKTHVFPLSKLQRTHQTTREVFQPKEWDRIEIILKITERCNISCTYCYFFNTDDNYKKHPVYIHDETVEDVIDFLVQMAANTKVKTLQIDFHGGEPLLMKKERFERFCWLLRNKLSNVEELRLALQTNGMLVDEEWISIFELHKVSIAVSLDGPEEYHDKYRLDNRGKGTYRQVIAGIEKLNAAAALGRIYAIGIICVPNPSFDAKRTLDHFVDDLGIKRLHFSIPGVYSEGYEQTPRGIYTKYLCDLFTAWIERGDRTVQIRSFNAYIARLVSGKKALDDWKRLNSKYTAFTIQSNGELNGPDDDRLAEYAFNTEYYATGKMQLETFFNSDEMSRYLASTEERSAICKSCCWGLICESGDILGGVNNRYSSISGHANPSIHCDALQELFVRMTNWALSKGVSMARIKEVLVH